MSVIKPAQSDTYAVTMRSSDTYHVTVIYEGDLTTADLYHIPTDTWATGHAKRLPEDSYDAEIGAELAYFRALERLSVKVIKKLRKGTL